EEHRRDIAQRFLVQNKGGAPEECIERQGGVRLPAVHLPEAPLRIMSSRVRRIRFSPRSRPSGLNHSWVVCAPPPIPPAPNAIAGLPMERGIFASVDEQSRCDRIPRCASTARTYCNKAASSGRNAAGRDPISFIRATTRPPVAR